VRTRLAAAALLALAACPLPQPLPVVGRTDGTTIAPPVILPATVAPPDAVVVLRPDCPAGTVVPFSATVEDSNLEDVVDARWFVDYTPQSSGIAFADSPPAAADGVDTRRALLPFQFEPALYASGGAHHVIELVVSNGFYPPNTPGLSQPNRSAQPGFETQLFRWFVMFDATTGTCPGG
jgi:hypothetical protein